MNDEKTFMCSLLWSAFCKRNVFLLLFILTAVKVFSLFQESVKASLDTLRRSKYQLMFHVNERENVQLVHIS